MKKLYLVTGAAGHLGSALCALLHARGEEVRALVLRGEDTSFLRRMGAQIFFGDVTAPESLIPFFDTPEDTPTVLIHCAGIVDITSLDNPAVDKVNVDGTQNVMRLCLANHIEKVVYVCSVHALPDLPCGRVKREIEHYDPALLDGAYARSKARAAAIVQEMAAQGLPAVTVLPSGIIGPYCGGGNHLVQLVKDFCRGKLSAIVKGGYDFVDVRDVAEGILSAAEHGRTGESYLLTGNYHSLKEMTDMLAEITGRKKVGAVPVWMAHLAVPFAEYSARRKNKKPLFTHYALRVVLENAHFSHDKAARELGYSPRDLYDTLEDTVEWLRETGEIPAEKSTAPRRRRIRAGATS